MSKKKLRKTCWEKNIPSGGLQVKPPSPPLRNPQSVGWLKAASVQQWWEGHNAAMRGLGKYWPIQPTQAQRWVVQCSYGACGHIIVQHSCFMSENRGSGSKPTGLLEKGWLQRKQQQYMQWSKREKRVWGGGGGGTSKKQKELTTRAKTCSWAASERSLLRLLCVRVELDAKRSELSYTRKLKGCSDQQINPPEDSSRQEKLLFLFHSLSKWWHTLTLIRTHIEREGRGHIIECVHRDLWVAGAALTRFTCTTTWNEYHMSASPWVSCSGVYDLSPNEGPGHDPSQGQGSASKV